MPTQTPNALSDYQLDPVAEGFFGRSGHEEGAEEHRVPELSRIERRAMRFTLAMLGLSGVALLAFVIYARVIMPVPAELGGDHAPQPPAAAQP
jgi:hypothetical protein